MRLVLALPSVWPIEGLSLDLAPLRAKPRDLDRLALTTLLRAVPSTIQLAAPTYGESTRGWPLRIQQVNVFAADVEIERRVLALYVVSDWVGLAMLTARDLAGYATHEPALRTMLESGEPDFADGTAHSLWDALANRSS